MVAVHGGIHGCSVAAGQSAVVLRQRNLRSVTSEELTKGADSWHWNIMLTESFGIIKQNPSLMLVDMVP